jgi:hypothetical protein
MRLHTPLGEQAYRELYGKDPDYRITVKYHGKLGGYNATVRKTPAEIIFTLSRKLEECEPEIQMGVMQFLLNKLLKTRVRSEHIDMYHSFLKKMSEYAPVTRSDPALEASFHRVNARYLDGLMTLPNLVWGRMSTRLLGTYTYATDTIMISQALRDAPEHLLDSVMHHEMLHKKHKFNHTSARTHSHTKAFRDDENRFTHNGATLKALEQELHRHLRGVRRRERRSDGEANDSRPASRQKTFFDRVFGR